MDTKFVVLFTEPWDENHSLEVYPEGMTMFCRNESQGFVKTDQMRHVAVGYKSYLIETKVNAFSDSILQQSLPYASPPIFREDRQ